MKRTDKSIFAYLKYKFYIIGTSHIAYAKFSRNQAITNWIKKLTF